MELQNNAQLQLAADFISSTNTHIFLTGRAGTGKTTFLRNLKNITFKRFVVIAPTGVAAINAGGVTIHSFFQLPFGPQLPEVLMKSNDFDDQYNAKASASRFQKFNREKINIIKSLDLLVIDEISMVRADMLDAIDAVLRRYRDRYQPFGGVQLLMIGDLQQLAPIAKEDEWNLLKNYYESVYFFSSKALIQTSYVGIELDQVFRQSDPHFIRLLNGVRDNDPDEAIINELNKRYLPEFANNEPEGYITLTTHNYQAQQINQHKLDLIKDEAYTYKAEIKGDFPEFAYPTEEKLELKIGAQVMFVKNDPSPAKQFFNGKIGKLVEIDEEENTFFVLCPDEDEPIAVQPLVWNNCKYSIDDETKEITETIIGTYTQFPLKLAWAITIHKSQGLTFEKAIIDAQAAFTHGQVYVALSRCKTLEGMVLRSMISTNAIKSNATVNNYIQTINENKPNEKQLQIAKAAYQFSLITELFDFENLKRRLGYIQKLVTEHHSSLENQFVETVAAIESKLRTELLEIANKFKPQLRQLAKDEPNIEINTTIQERIRKACIYFDPLVKQLTVLIDIQVETDNKVIKKSVQDAVDRLVADVFVKMACIELCKNGFTVSKYLETRAKASIETPLRKKKKTVLKAQQKTNINQSSFILTLKSWRNDLAAELDLEKHQIIPLKTVNEIASHMPSSRAELLKIHGMGRVRVEKYGAKILQLINDFQKKQNKDFEIDETPLDEPEKKGKKPESKLQSFEAFQSGKSIAEIASDRGYAISTIEGHLAHYVKKGDITIDKLVSAEKLALIREYFTETEDLHLGPAKEVLGDAVSYGELRLVLNQLIAEGILQDFENHSNDNQ